MRMYYILNKYIYIYNADVERMFNISGFIFNPKRRSLGVDNCENLVLLKFNETYL